jgi:hypothetical protein
LEQPGNATACSHPEQESDAATLLTMVAIGTRVDHPPPPHTESPAPAASKVEEDVAGGERDAAEGPRVEEPAPEIPSSEPILPPPPASTVLPAACLILAGEVVGTQL